MNWSGSQLDRNDIVFTSLWGNMGGAHDRLPHALGTPLGPTSIRGTNSTENGDIALTPEEMVNVILGYLPMMVSQEPPAPPFIHDQIYRCGDGDVKEPIARARYASARTRAPDQVICKKASSFPFGGVVLGW